MLLKEVSIVSYRFLVVALPKPVSIVRERIGGRIRERFRDLIVLGRELSSRVSVNRFQVRGIGRLEI